MNIQPEIQWLQGDNTPAEVLERLETILQNEPFASIVDLEDEPI